MAFTTTDVVANLPGQILEVLRDQRMSLSQVSTYFSLKHRSSLTERIKGANAASLKEYLEGLEHLFEVQGEFVKARPKEVAQSGNSEKPAIISIRYAHISKCIQNILNDTHSKSMTITDLEGTFKTTFGVSLGSIIGMSTVEYLQRKANVFEIENDMVVLQSAFHKQTELKIDMEKEKMAWADLPMLPEPFDMCTKANDTQKEPTPAVNGLLNSVRNVAETGSVAKVAASTTAAEVRTQAESDRKKQEGASKEKKCENLPLFAIDELVRIFEEHSEGPIMHSSVLCSLFMQQLGASVTEISGKKPMELFRQNPHAFIWLSSGNVALAKYREDKAVQHELKLLEEQPKSVRVKAAAAEAALPVPETITEADVLKYMIDLLHENEDRDSIYISALCGRFMQRFRKPVTEVVGCKPTDFLKKYDDIFYLEKGGHVKLISHSESLAKLQAVTSLNKPPLSTAKLEAAEANPAPKSAPVEVPPPVRPWRRSAPETDKDQEPSVSRQAATTTKVDAEVQQKIDDFCTRLRKQLFFRVAEVSSGSPIQAPLSVPGRPSDIVVTVKVLNLPKEMEAQWLPQLLDGLQDVLKLKFALEVDGIILQADGVRCRLQSLHVDLLVRLVVV